MTQTTFTIPGEPKALKRPRFGKGRAYDPAENLRAKNAIAGAFRSQCPDFKALEGPVQLTVCFWHAWPKSYTKKRRASFNGHMKDTKPDTDNCIKCVMDGLNGWAWKDDAQVASLTASKFFTDKEPCTVVSIVPLRVGDL